MNWNELDVSEDTVNLLNSLIERKEKLDRMKLKLTIYSLMTLATLFFFIVYFYRLILVPSNGDMLQIIDMIAQYPVIFFLLAAFISGILYANHLSKKVEINKDRLDVLRVEVIDKLDSTWLRTIKSDVRDKISREMQIRHGINILFKTKDFKK